MHSTFFSVLKTLLLVMALSADALVASFAFGARKVKIPAISIVLINIICTLFLAVSILLGKTLTPYLPAWLTTSICFAILFTLGLIKLFQKPDDGSNFSLGKHHIEIDNYLSPIEACLLAIALSLDGLSVGFGIGLSYMSLYQIIIFSFVCNTAAILGGFWMGNLLAEKIPFNANRFSGLLLILLAFLRL